MIKNEIKLFSMSAGEYDSIPCTAPFTLLSVLLDGGYIDDPLYGMNTASVREKIPKSCKFSADIEMSGDALCKKHVYIRISGVYAFAEIFFNGRSCGAAYDPNRVYLFDVTDRIKESGNILEVACLEPLADRRPINNLGFPANKYTTAPYLGDMGIIGKCEVLFTNHGFIADAYVRQEHDKDTVALSVGAHILGASSSARLIATLVSPSGKLFYGAMSNGECRILVTSPEFWMPVGFGKPSLYKLSLTLYEGEEASDTYERMIGLRDVSLSKNDEGTYKLSFGGCDIFALGATYVTSDPVLSRITYSSAERFIKNAASSGMNTLRIADGGICPPDFFYDLCDKYGIMVCQDISVPYLSDLPSNRGAHALADAVLDVLAKISAHPCVVCAEYSLYEIVGRDKPSAAGESREFFDVLNKLVFPEANKYIDGICFPMYADELESFDERYHTGEDKSLIALPSEEALSLFLPEENMNILSPAMRLHGLSDAFAKKMLCELVSVSKFPSGLSETVYATQMTAYHLFLSSVGKARAEDSRKSFGIICRQYNDAWPCVSSSFTDWYGERKSISYAAKKAFAPIGVFARFDGCRALISVMNETSREFEGKLMIAVYTMKDKCVFESTRNVSVGASENILSVDEDFSKFFADLPDRYYMIYTLSDVKGIVASGSFTVLMPRDMHYEDPKIEASVEGSGRNFTLKLTSSAYAPYVRVWFEGRAVALSDNYFDITSYAPVMIKATSENVCTAEELAARIRIQTVYGIGKERKG